MNFSKVTLLMLSTSAPSAAFRLGVPPQRSRSSIGVSLSPQRLSLQHQVALFSTTSPEDTSTDNLQQFQTDNDRWEEDHHDDVEGQHNEDDNAEEEDEEDPLLEEYAQWNKAVQKALKALEKKQTSLEKEATKAQQVEGTMARAQLIVNNLYMFNAQETVYTVVDWEQDGEEVELRLDPQYESASAEADALFAQARKLKRGSKVVQELLEQVDSARQVLADCQTDLVFENDQIEQGRFRLVQDRLRRTSGSTQFKEPSGEQQNSSARATKKSNYPKKPAMGTPASNVRKLLTPGGATVLVGRNRRGNEYLSLSYARGNDVWMHARGSPGAHVLVLDRRGSVRPTEACLEFAAHLAAFYSDARSERNVPITLAEPKHVQKPRGAPLGAVKLREEGQVLYGFPDRVPMELQEARAQSGVYASEEYRSADKAKHRKYTKKVQKEQQKQKRQQQRKKRKNNKPSESNNTLPDFY